MFSASCMPIGKLVTGHLHIEQIDDLIIYMQLLTFIIPLFLYYVD